MLFYSFCKKLIQEFALPAENKVPNTTTYHYYAKPYCLGSAKSLFYLLKI